MNTKTDARAAWAAAYARREALASPSWLSALRRAAWERVGALGLPHARLEEWRFTNPAPITQAAFADGRFEPSSTAAGAAWTGTLAEALRDPARAASVERALGHVAQWQERAFLALNTALIEDALVVDADGEALVRFEYAPIPAGHAAHPRALVIAGKGAKLTVVEDFRASQAAGAYVNPVIEFDLADGAVVEHVSILGDVPGALHTGAAFARLGAGARFVSRSIALGGRLTRRDVHVTFAGEGGEADLDGVYVAAGDDLVDHHTVADHAVPRCTSRELFKGVLAGRARAVFNGAVIIRPDAQKSDAAQQNQNLLLSEDAMIDTKPELQIFADDVKCAHGATVGQLDDAALFYLRARGIDPRVARAMLTHAFAREVVERIGPADLRAEVDAIVAARIEGLAS